MKNLLFLVVVFILLGCAGNQETILYREKRVKIQMRWNNNTPLTTYEKVRKIKIIIDGYLDKEGSYPVDVGYSTTDILRNGYLPELIPLANFDDQGRMIYYQATVIFLTGTDLECFIGYSEVFTLEPVEAEAVDALPTLDLVLVPTEFYDESNCS